MLAAILQILRITPMTLKLLSILGALFGILGALSVASAFHILLGYYLLIVGSTLWVVYGYIVKNTPLVSMNFVFTLINLLGILNYS